MNNNENRIIGYDPKTGNPIYAHNNYNPNAFQHNFNSNQNTMPGQITFEDKTYNTSNQLNNNTNMYPNTRNSYNVNNGGGWPNNNSYGNNNYYGGNRVQNNGQGNFYSYGNTIPNGQYNPSAYQNTNRNTFMQQKTNQLNNPNFNNIPRLSGKSKTFKVGAIFLILFVLIVISFFAISNNSGSDYYFPDDGYSDYDNPTPYKKKGKYQTAIVYDNQYYAQAINGVSDAKKLIVNDSVSQKNNCPSEIVTIENELINKYNITAANLCEMDYEYAKELVKVFEHIYNEYPEARQYLTNVSLMNTPKSQSSTIACFMPFFDFAYSNTKTEYPVVMKTQILLNTIYFLNIPYLQMAVEDGSASGHFPPNATVYSPVAHELGHYISYIAMMKHYNISSVILYDTSNSNKYNSLINDFSNGNYSLEMITAAYNRYKKEKGTNLSLDQWRATISKYAMAKDNYGNYIYDETIAEAFHDVYLNGTNAKDASKYIVAELKERIK
ncbi:MAG: hypothetical protein IJR82_03845 [Bacilli bacterium]|nr:hypothetical protein [Bacilli bacterium]